MSYSVLFSLSLFRGSHGKKYQNIILDFLRYGKGKKVDAKDSAGNWTTAIILNTDYDNNKVKVGYLHWARIYDEWIHERFIRPPESMVWIDTSSPPLPNRYVMVETDLVIGTIWRRAVVLYSKNQSELCVRLLGRDQQVVYFKDFQLVRPLTMKKKRLKKVLASIV